jgi:hypothetical protein
MIPIGVRRFFMMVMNFFSLSAIYPSLPSARAMKRGQALLYFVA